MLSYKLNNKQRIIINRGPADRMRAILCTSYGPPESLVLKDVPRLTPGAGEIIIRVKAASLNFPDVLIIQNQYQVKPHLPFSPGSEAAGVVSAVGKGVTRVAPGHRVMAFTTYGAFADEVKVDARLALPIPDGMTFETAAAFGLTYATSDFALRDRAELTPSETLLVLGAAGGVGLSAIEIGKAIGATVIATASSDAKLAICRVHGADATIDYTNENLRERARELTQGRGPDVIYDPVGGPYTELALRSIAWRGRHLVVGFASGDIPRIPLNLTLLKGCAIVGVFWGDYVRREPERFAESMRQLGRWYAEGRLKPHISMTLPLERAADALRLMLDRQATGKIVLTM